MGGFLDKMRQTTGIGLNETELYNRAYEKGVLLKDFNKAADMFNDAAKKYSKRGNQLMATQASANSMLYRYLVTNNASILPQLLQVLNGLQQIETIGPERTMMPTAPLCAEIDCRMVETTISQASTDDILRLRDLHKLVGEKFKAILPYPLITYEYVKASDGHNERTDERYFFHNGMYQYYEAMTRKDSDPAAAADDLSLAMLSFQHSNDQRWVQSVKALLDNWRVFRTCWICHREVQGFELHFSMYNATVTPYTKRLVEVLKQDSSSINLDSMKIAVCTPCGSMITFKAKEEANEVRRELTTRLDTALSLIAALDKCISHLDKRISHLERGLHQ